MYINPVRDNDPEEMTILCRVTDATTQLEYRPLGKGPEHLQYKIYRAAILMRVLSSISIKGKPGIMVPSEKQVGTTTVVYQELSFQPIVVGTSPYASKKAIFNAVNGLKEKVALVVMDCFGYDLNMKRRVSEITGTPAKRDRYWLSP